MLMRSLDSRPLTTAARPEKARKVATRPTQGATPKAAADSVTLSRSKPATPKLANLGSVAEESANVAAAQTVAAAAGTAVAQAVFAGLKTGFVKGYIDPQATLQQCRQLAEKYPNLVELVEQDIQSHGYDGKRTDLRGPANFYYMRLGPRDTDRGEKLGVFQHAAPHAREHVNPMTMVELAEQLCANYDPESTDPAVVANTRLMNSLDIYLAPQPNPDGANYSFYDDKKWRKNRAPFDGVDGGVDINRNYPYKWAGSDRADYQTYPGKGPASEPETRALIDVVDKNPNIRFVVDWHSYGEEIRKPLGASKEDVKVYDEFHGRMKDAIASSRGRQYGTVVSSVVEGSSDDYWYHTRGIFSSVIETAKQFQPEQGEALQVAQECARGAREALEFAADYAAEHGLAKANPPVGEAVAVAV